MQLWQQVFAGFAGGGRCEQSCCSARPLLGAVSQGVWSKWGPERCKPPRAKLVEAPPASSLGSFPNLLLRWANWRFSVPQGWILSKGAAQRGSWTGWSRWCSALLKPLRTRKSLHFWVGGLADLSPGGGGEVSWRRVVAVPGQPG